MKDRPRGALVDVLAVLLLVGLAVLALARTFEGWGYLVVAELAALLGVLVARLTARLPGAVLVAAVPLVALVFGGPIALRSQGFGLGIPDPATLTDVLQGTWTSWGQLLTTLPWVDLSGAPAMVPFLLGYVGAVLAGALALRTRSAAMPLLPLVGVLAVALLLRRPGGTGSDLLDWYPVAFAAVAIGWLVLRSLRTAAGAGVPGAGQGRFGRGATAALVVAGAIAVAVPLTVPMSSTGSPAPTGKQLRGDRTALTGLPGLDSPLRRFRTFTDQGPGSLDNVYDKVLFTVTNAPRNSRVRMVTLDRYDGNEWLPSNGTDRESESDGFLRLDSRVDNPQKGRAIRAKVTVSSAYRSVWVPTIGSLTSLNLIFADPRQKRDELRYNLATSTAVVPTGIGRSEPYEFTAIVPPSQVNVSSLRWAGPGLQISGLKRLNAFLPGVLDAYIRPMKKVFILAGYLHDVGRYSDGALPGEEQYKAGQDLHRLVEDFLLASRPVGDDQQYASAMALLANRVGVPARVVVGAVVPDNGKVKGADVHAWVELRVADGSWRTLPTKAFMSRTPPTRTLPPPPPQLPPATADTPQDQQQAQSKAKRPDTPPAVEHGIRIGVRLLPFALLLLLALVVPTVKAVRRRRRRTHGRTADRIAGGWTELVDRARDLGVPVGVDASRPAQARVMALAGGGELSRQADDRVFSAAEPSEEAVRAFWDQMMAERKDLSEGRRLLRRIWAPFNPVTLRRRHPGGGSRPD